MGKVGDAMAVVDSRARVFGVKGLRVVDVSALAHLHCCHQEIRKARFVCDMYHALVWSFEAGANE